MRRYIEEGTLSDIELQVAPVISHLSRVAEYKACGQCPRMIRPGRCHTCKSRGFLPDNKEAVGLQDIRIELGFIRQSIERGASFVGQESIFLAKINKIMLTII